MDELDARLRSMRPDDIDRHAPIPGRVERHRQLVLRRARGADRSRRSLVLTTAAAVLVVIATVFGVIKGGGDQAYALTPPPLNFEQDDRKVGDIITNALSRLGAAAGPDSPERYSSYVGWFAQIDMDKPQSPVIIAPELVTLTWRDDFSAEQTVTAADAYWADPESQDPLDSEAPTPGSVLSDTIFEPGEFGVPEAAAPGEDTQDMQKFLSLFGLHPHSGAGDIMEAIDSAMSLWTLTNQQHARLLEILLAAGDVELLGTATDRAGRSVVGLRAEPQSFPGTSRTLLISAETGRIVGIETTRTTAEPPLESGDVVAYKLWEVSP